MIVQKSSTPNIAVLSCIPYTESPLPCPSPKFGRGVSETGRVRAVCDSNENRYSFCDLHPEKDREFINHYQIAPRNSPSPILDGLRVLVVDDSADNLELVEMIFELYQAQVQTVASVDEAIKVIEEWTPDILISDISMPNKDGYSLIHSIRIKEAEVGGFLPAVALTGFVFPENRRLAFNSGFQMFITKPFDADELVTVVAKLTGRTV